LHVTLKVAPGAAAPLRRTYRVVDLPAETVSGITATVRIVGGFTVTDTEGGVEGLVPAHAWTVAAVADKTGVVAAENGTEVAPAGTVIVAGTDVEPELLVRFT
jgi:hypothetical protein